jgi:hypothetical protein
VIELERWVRAANYCGDDFSDYYVVCGQHRDSGCVQQSNFIVATQRLGGENEPEVIIARSSHWAVGWVENLMVHKDAEEKVMIATDIVNDIEKCGVLDDDHWYELKSVEVDRLVAEIKSDIADGDAKYWEHYGITADSDDDEIYEIADGHVN